MLLSNLLKNLYAVSIAFHRPAVPIVCAVCNRFPSLGVAFLADAFVFVQDMTEGGDGQGSIQFSQSAESAREIVAKVAAASSKDLQIEVGGWLLVCRNLAASIFPRRLL